jgi:hypothetical protein
MPTTPTLSNASVVGSGTPDNTGVKFATTAYPKEADLVSV